MTLKTYCRLREIEDVHYLKTDTEGFDLFVLTGFDWDRYSPLAVMCEFEDSKTRPLGYAYQDLVELLDQLKYTVWVSEWLPVTEYGAEHSWLELRQTPHELTCERSWGNLIALRDPITDDEMQAFAERRTRMSRFS